MTIGQVILSVVIGVFVAALLFSPEIKAGLSKARPTESQGVEEVRLKDGTRCVVGTFRGGITCEWKNQ